MTEDERRAYLAESLFLNTVKYENDGSSALHAEARARAEARPESSSTETADVAELPRHPLHVLLAVAHRRACSATAASSAAAPTRTRKRVLGDARTDVDRRHLDTARPSADCARDLNAGGSSLLRRLPAQAAARRRTSRRRSATSTSAPLPGRLYIECTAACNISCFQACCAPETGITRTRQAGMLDFDLFTTRRRRGRTDARPHRLLQLRRGVPAQARRRDVRVHQDARSRTSTSTRAPTAWRSPTRQARRLVRSGIDEVTFSIDGASQESYVQLPPARQLRQGDRQPAGAWSTRSARPAATCRSSTGATSCSTGTTATRRWTARASWPPRSASIGCAGRSPITREDAFSRRFAPGTPDYERIRHEIWDDNDLGNAIPGATPRAEIDVHAVLPDLPFSARGRRPADARPRGCATSRRGRSATHGQLRPPAGPPRRAAAATTDGALIDRDYARAVAARRPRRRRRDADVPIEIPAPDRPGRYAAEVRPGQRRASTGSRPAARPPSLGGCGCRRAWGLGLGA